MLELKTADNALSQECAVALGFFDGVHCGHRAVLKAAVACAETQNLLPCAFTFAADSIRVKQGVPLSYLYTDAQKQSRMEDCGIRAVYCPPFSDLHTLGGEAFCRRVLVELFHAKEVFCGGDFRFGAKAAWDFDALCAFGKSMGFRVHLVDPVMCGTEKISSRMIRQALLDGEPEYAAKLLGAPYRIIGKVAHGNAIGRTKEVPTINMPFANGQLVPKYGVYVSRTQTPQGEYDSITNIGVKPTVSESGIAGAETYLLDFSGDLYETSCSVELLHFLRPERKFSELNELYHQIAEDQKNCRLWRQENENKYYEFL